MPRRCLSIGLTTVSMTLFPFFEAIFMLPAFAGKIDGPHEIIINAKAARFVAVNATDDGPGTAERPWATINHAADKAVAGDTVVVRGGRCSPSRLRFAPAPELAQHPPPNRRAAPFSSRLSRYVRPSDCWQRWPGASGRPDRAARGPAPCCAALNRNAQCPGKLHLRRAERLRNNRRGDDRSEAWELAVILAILDPCADGSASVVA